MKKKMLKAARIILVLVVMMSVASISASAATKSITLKVAKEGKQKQNRKRQKKAGLMKFKAPSKGTYRFSFSKFSADGEATLYVSTDHGIWGWFGETEKSSGKIKLKKGEVVYFTCWIGPKKNLPFSVTFSSKKVK